MDCRGLAFFALFLAYMIAIATVLVSGWYRSATVDQQVKRLPIMVAAVCVLIVLLTREPLRGPLIVFAICWGLVGLAMYVRMVGRAEARAEQDARERGEPPVEAARKQAHLDCTRRWVLERLKES